MKTLTKTKSKAVDTKAVNETVLKLFNKALVDEKSVTLNFKDVSEISVKLGYLVHPDLCNDTIFNWLQKQKRDYNSTFYKRWTDVITKNRFELYLDQLKHYASTYGTNYTGETYLPEGKVDVPAFTTFKVILPITKDEVITRCENMLFSGIALKQETIEDVLSILNGLNHTIKDINKVKNKETKMFLFKTTNTLPTEANEMVRFLVYLATDKTLLIKDKATIEAIKASNIDITKEVELFGYEKLSSVFLRFKPLFLAFKTRKINSECVNKLRKLAKKHHKPLEAGYFERLLSNPGSYADLQDKLATITNFKKVSLLQAILVRLKEHENRAFVVRNQKLYIKQESKKADKKYLNLIFDVIYSDLVESLSKNKCSVKLPIGVNLTLPTSEKSFIGNYPLGTSFDLSETDAIVGIHWRGEDGAQDLDLKLIDIDGKQFGWNAAYKNADNSIVFSGDMTRANPEATELFYASKGFKPSIVKVNLFNGQDNSKFKFFLAKEKKNVKKESGYYGYEKISHMVDPNNIIVNVDCEMDSKEKTLGVITDNKFVLAQFRTGKGRVAHNSVTDLYTNYALDTIDCYISIRELLTDAGYTITDGNDAKIDLTELSKDTLMELLKN